MQYARLWGFVGISVVWDFDGMSVVWDFDGISVVWDFDGISVAWDFDGMSVVWDFDVVVVERYGCSPIMKCGGMYSHTYGPKIVFCLWCFIISYDY